jgi:glycosyltransferase involved in cell wall biosynthesis
MLLNLNEQWLLPYEVVIVDGAPTSDSATEEVVRATEGQLAYRCVYVRGGGGTAIQRNIGIDRVQGDFVAFIDDDIRLEPAYFQHMAAVYRADENESIGGLAGYITNQYLDASVSPRWQWYRRLRLFSTYEPGRFDFETGYPINRYLQPPHEGLREIDFMGSNCAVWRRSVCDEGLRFSEFFRDYGMLEDAHFALRARLRWKLMEVGYARCEHLAAPGGRQSSRMIARKTAVNYRYVFLDVVRDMTLRRNLRFWRVQAVDLFRMAAHAARTFKADDWLGVVGKVEGIIAAARLRTPNSGQAVSR